MPIDLNAPLAAADPVISAQIENEVKRQQREDERAQASQELHAHNARPLIHLRSR